MNFQPTGALIYMQRGFGYDEESFWLLNYDKKVCQPRGEIIRLHTLSQTFFFTQGIDVSEKVSDIVFSVS